jgi:hypothetical protein
MVRRKWPLATGLVLGVTFTGSASAQDKVQLPAPMPVAAESNNLKSPMSSAGTTLLPAPQPVPPTGAHSASEPPASGPTHVSALQPSGWQWCKDGMRSISARAEAGYYQHLAEVQRCRERAQACFLGFPEEFVSPPLGYFVHLNGQAMVANGTAARMTLYHYDFIDGQLSVRGKYQLAKIAAMASHSFAPIVIEETPEAPALSRQRLVAVLNELSKQAFPVAPDRVVIGRPMSIGLRGAEAVTIALNQASFVRQGGPIPSTQGGGISGVGLLAYPFPGGATGISGVPGVGATPAAGPPGGP